MSSEDYQEWTTKAEIDFLNGIGTGKHRDDEYRYLPGVTRRTLLEGYKKSLDLRTRWGDVDEDKVRIHLDKLFKKLK